MRHACHGMFGVTLTVEPMPRSGVKLGRPVVALGAGGGGVHSRAPHGVPSR
jgi:hypothetical protein